MKKQESEGEVAVVIESGEEEQDGDEIPEGLFDSCAEVGAWPLK